MELLSRPYFTMQPIWDHQSLSRSILSKLSISYYHQYALNRAPLNYRLFNIKKTVDPYCRNDCKKLETMDHILFKCKAK